MDIIEKQREIDIRTDVEIKVIVSFKGEDKYRDRKIARDFARDIKKQQTKKD